MLTTTGAPTTCSFDALGNLHTEWTGAQGTTYAWDTANRLTHVDLPDGTHEDNRYRADGLRDWHYGPTGETYYTWDEGQVLLEKASSFVPQAIYTVAPPDGEAASPGGVISYKRGADLPRYWVFAKATAPGRGLRIVGHVFWGHLNMHTVPVWDHVECELAHRGIDLLSGGGGVPPNYPARRDGPDRPTIIKMGEVR